MTDARPLRQILFQAIRRTRILHSVTALLVPILPVVASGGYVRPAFVPRGGSSSDSEPPTPYDTALSSFLRSVMDVRSECDEYLERYEETLQEQGKEWKRRRREARRRRRRAEEKTAACALPLNALEIVREVGGRKESEQDARDDRSKIVTVGNSATGGGGDDYPTYPSVLGGGNASGTVSVVLKNQPDDVKEPVRGGFEGGDAGATDDLANYGDPSEITVEEAGAKKEKRCDMDAGELEEDIEDKAAVKFKDEDVFSEKEDCKEDIIGEGYNEKNEDDVIDQDKEEPIEEIFLPYSPELASGGKDGTMNEFDASYPSLSDWHEDTDDEEWTSDDGWTSDNDGPLELIETETGRQRAESFALRTLAMAALRHVVAVFLSALLAKVFFSALGSDVRIQFRLF